jgi:N-acetylmuramoyl-L-alanine amidase
MMSGRTIVIDPGHGGSELAGGSSPNNAVGANGLLEKDLTLEIARRVAAALDDRFTVTLTRSGDTNSSLTERTGVAKAANGRTSSSLSTSTAVGTPRSTACSRCCAAITTADGAGHPASA